MSYPNYGSYLNKRVNKLNCCCPPGSGGGGGSGTGPTGPQGPQGSQGSQGPAGPNLKTASNRLTSTYQTSSTSSFRRNLKC